MSHILDEVKEVLKEREANAYGPAGDMFEKIGLMWTNYLGISISSRDVAIMMTLLKIARENYKSKRDNFVDAIGYLVLASEFEN